jgi:NDP-sugar pyrophosphorylase family protein
MHIIVPMSGVGQRFLDAGYKEAKPLIVVDGKHIIEHVCALFPGEDKFTFICSAQLLAGSNIREVLLNIKPNGNIVEIPNHKKGPVYAVSCIANIIEDEEEVIVNYCDFGTYWDYSDFLEHTRQRHADGAIPSYKGFHPHMLGKTNYAFMRDKDQWMLEIKEKEPFTDNRMQEYASNGTYYFKKGSYVKKYFRELMENDINVHGEYYVSLVYNLLVRDKLTVSIYEIQHMLQWGAPEDLESYRGWSTFFTKSIQQTDVIECDGSVTLIPLAGKGSRFVDAGYDIPKPLLEVSGKPMIVQAASYVPNGSDTIYVCLGDHLDAYPLQQEIQKEYPNAHIERVENVTEGQAITCQLGIKGVDKERPLHIAASDNGMLYDHKKYARLIKDPAVDAVVWTFKDHASSNRNPQMYSWVETRDDHVVRISPKAPISDDPINDHAMVGSFYFRRIRSFTEALDRLIAKGQKIGGEYYVDSVISECIDMGLIVKVFEVDHYICWGTPDDYETFMYWQSFFHKASWHPYSLNNDPRVSAAAIERLDAQYRTFYQEHRDGIITDEAHNCHTLL